MTIRRPVLSSFPNQHDTMPSSFEARKDSRIRRSWHQTGFRQNHSKGSVFQKLDRFRPSCTPRRVNRGLQPPSFATPLFVSRPSYCQWFRVDFDFLIPHCILRRVNRWLQPPSVPLLYSSAKSKRVLRTGSRSNVRKANSSSAFDRIRTTAR
jgi:hypothetical protein